MYFKIHIACILFLPEDGHCKLKRLKHVAMELFMKKIN